VKEYRTKLVHVEKLEDVTDIIAQIKNEHPDRLDKVPEGDTSTAQMEAWDQCNG
jgi:hypothetical protein